MMKSGRKKILVIDSTKFDQKAFSVAGSMKEVDMVVTDKRPEDRWRIYFEKLGIECRYPV